MGRRTTKLRVWNRWLKSGETPATVAVKLASPVRPHTLHLPASEQPPNARNVTPDSGTHPSMASCESIGSCSLDVDATVSDASEFIEEKSISERTLHSVPLSSSKTPDKDNIRPSYISCSALSSPGTVGASTPEYVKKTAQKFESSSPVENKDTGSRISYSKISENIDTVPSFVISENSLQKENFLNGTEFPAKKPSYLGLSCSISGYSGITTYDSKLREGFRSRDHSPGRLVLIRSREASPSRYGANQTNPIDSCFTSECGNFLLPGPRSTDMYKLSPSNMNGTKTDSSVVTNGCVNGFSNMSNKIDEVHEKTVIMNGKDRNYVTTNGCHLTNGSLDSNVEKQSIIYTDYSSKGKSVVCESHSEVSSTIKESSRYFLSSMLNSESVCETVSSRNCVNNHTGLSESILTRSPLTVTSKKYKISESVSNSAKCSPESPKNGSKDSLNTPNLSPHKHSPGTVRVVEFTSQEKSYVHSTSLRSSVVSGDSVDMSSTSQSTRSSIGHLETLTTQESYSVNQLGSSVSDGDVCKSFILQRVERLYGPGALAQGFFKRTVNRPKEENEDEDSKMTQTAVRATESSPALPVLRHLRPEFRAQLAVARPARRFIDKETNGQKQCFPAAVESSRPQIEVPVLLQQVSVESLPESLPDLQPAAPEVVLPIDQLQVSASELNLSTNSEDGYSSEEKEGHLFLKLLKKETDRLNELAAQAENDLASVSNLSEEILGKLRAASGQARLLMKQKLQQFEGLCHKNINQNPDEQFPTTREDLAGFWDMVSLQIDHVDSLFKEIDQLRSNNWQEEEPVSKDKVPGSGKCRSTPTKKASTKSSSQNEELRKARDDARRKMMEEKRKAMRNKSAESKNDSVEIYVPQENGK